MLLVAPWPWGHGVIIEPGGLWSLRHTTLRYWPLMFLSASALFLFVSLLLFLSPRLFCSVLLLELLVVIVLFFSFDGLSLLTLLLSGTVKLAVILCVLSR